MREATRSGAFRHALLHMLVPAAVMTAAGTALDRASEAAEAPPAEAARSPTTSPARGWVATGHGLAWTRPIGGEERGATTCLVEVGTTLTETGEQGTQARVLVGGNEGPPAAGDCPPGGVAYVDPQTMASWTRRVGADGRR